MSIDTDKMPPEARDAVNQALAASALASQCVSCGPPGAGPEALSTAMPHQAAYLLLDKIKSDKSLRDIANIRSWRFLVYEKRQHRAESAEGTPKEFEPVGVATVTLNRAGHYELSQLRTGPFAGRLEAAIEAAQRLPEVRAGRFEVLFLTVSTLQVAALWLRNRDDSSEDADIILPLLSHVQGSSLRSDRKLKSAAFLRSLRSLAKRISLQPRTTDSFERQTMNY